MTEGDDKFWLRVSDGKVIRASESKAEDRLGPYDTAEEAANGLNALHEREAKLEAQDRAWNGEEQDN